MKLEDVIKRGTRAAQPTATTVPVGTLYYVTDEEVTERSNGTTWDDCTDQASVVGGITQLTGNVTAGPGSGSQAATIANDAVITTKILDKNVTYGKIQDVTATSRILGRKTAGSGVIEECTLSEILDFISSAAQGDVLYRDAAGWARLAAGDSGKYLKTQGAGANPTWDTPSVGGNLVVTRKELSEAEIESWQSAPIELVAAQGADKIIVPISFSIELIVTASYGNTPNLSLFWGTDSNNLVNGAIGLSINATGTKFTFRPAQGTLPVFVYSSYDPRNKALNLKGSADPSGAGSATGNCTVAYHIVTVT